MKNFCCLFCLIFLFCTNKNNADIRYNHLTNKTWKLDYIVLNGKKLNYYPFTLVKYKTVMGLHFSNKTCKENCIQSLYNDFKDKKGRISSKDKQQMDEICQEECTDYDYDQKKLIDISSCLHYTYYDFCNGSDCTYHIDKNRLILNNCGFTGAKCGDKNINIEDLDSIIHLSFSIAFRNNLFIVNDDSLVLSDSLGYSLVLKPNRKK